MKTFFLFSLLLFVAIQFSCSEKQEVISQTRPNILFCIADDWGWPHAGVYGDQVVKTPTFDKLAGEGVLFENAFISSPSCTPSRGAILTGQHFWRLKEGANLWSTLDVNIPVYPLLLEKEGYFTGSWRKSWGPGDLTPGGYDSLLPAGKKYPDGFGQFLTEKPSDQPFCFWLGASDPHRGYDEGSGVASGINLNQIDVPPFLPNNDTVKSDIADYYFEVQRFDSDIAKAIHLLDSMGELENTIIVVTGDHGMPFPRCKGNLYDMGSRIPLVVWDGRDLKQNKKITQPVSLTDLAPTFLELAGVEKPEVMTGQSLMPFLAESTESSNREFVVFGRERHTPAQKSPSIDGYPSRGIRTSKYLYIHNFFPERWPAGVPDSATHPMNSFADCDNGPTKTVLINNMDNPDYQTVYELCFGKRPKEELYDIEMDPFQLHNLADDSEYSTKKQELADLLFENLTATEDPRVLNNGIDFDSFPYRSKYALNQ